MSNNKQSSVEWLVEKTKRQEWYTIEQEKFIEQAKAMHKEEVVDAYREGRSDQQSARNQSFYHRNAEQYYNEIYGKN